MNEENATTWTAEDIAIRKSLSARGTCRDPLGRWPDGDNADYRAMLSREWERKYFVGHYLACQRANVSPRVFFCIG